MREVMAQKTKVIYFDDLYDHTPIFAFRDKKLAGVIVYEPEGWVLRLSQGSNSNGHHESQKALIKSCYQYGYKFFITE